MFTVQLLQPRNFRRMSCTRQNHTCCLIPDFQGLEGLGPTIFPQQPRCGRFRLTFGLLTTVAPSLKTPEALRFARPTRHILPRSPHTNAKLRWDGRESQGTFSEEAFGTTSWNHMLRKLNYILTNQLRSLGALRATTAQTTSTTYRLARMNSRNLSNIATHFHQRQPHSGASNH